MVRPIILCLIFIGAIVTFSIMINKENKALTATMPEATLPVVSFVYNDIVINELHGYVAKMDIGTMREVITPIKDENEINLEILAYNNDIKRVGYEIRSLDGEFLLIDDNNLQFIQEGDKVTCSIKLPELLEINEEYSMALSLSMEDRDVYYYARLIKAEGCYVDESLEFALQFHEYTFRDDADTFIPTYMDPATGDATTLDYVDLTCTLNQITWADFGGARLSDPVATIEEIDDSYNIVTLSYVMTNVNEYHEVEYYNVEEYYRLRQATKRMYVLNFERRMNQIFRVENHFIRNNNAIVLGIRNPKIEYMSNDTGDSIAFVQEGELWSYNRVSNMISQVFSFQNMEGIGAKENWDQHDIQIIQIDEAGSVTFAVYGYMNRGVHEGQVGIGVYYYDGIAHTIEEQVFIESNQSYDALKTQMGDLLYVNEQKLLYLMMNDKVYQIDLTTYDVLTKLENVEKGEYAVSESHRFFAWIDHEKSYSSSVIHIADLKIGITFDITEENGKYLRPLGFLGEDFIYGIAQSEMVKKDVVGDLVFPMSTLKIINTYEEKKEVIKEYTPIRGYIEAIRLEEQNIYISLFSESEGQYQTSGEDIIMNRDLEIPNGVTVSTIVTEEKQTQRILTMKQISSEMALTTMMSRHVLLEEVNTVKLDKTEKELYYVYAKGEAMLATSDLSEAIIVANQNLGVVVDENRSYIWKRARSTSRSAFKNILVNEADVSGGSVVKCISAILMHEKNGVSVTEPIAAGQLPKDILQNALSEAFVIELHGCATDELLYFIDQGTPVMAYIGNEEAILLIGYSASYVHYYNPHTGSTESLEIAEADKLFKKGGNHFIVYVK